MVASSAGTSNNNRKHKNSAEFDPNIVMNENVEIRKCKELLKKQNLAGKSTRHEEHKEEQNRTEFEGRTRVYRMGVSPS